MITKFIHQLFRHPIIIILVLAAVVRLAFLNFLPTGMTNDELHFVLNAKAVFYNFTNIKGNWHPMSLSTIPGEASSELTFLVLAPFLGPLPTNLFTARLPFVLFSLATLYLTYLISKKLFSSRLAAFIALAFALNPWSIYVARTSFDAPIALFFFTLTLYLMLTLRSWSLLFAFIPAFFAFYTYIGTKILLLPFMVIAAFFCYRFYHSKRYFLPYFALIILTGILTLFFVINLRHQPTGSRISELTSPQSQLLIDQVDAERNLTFNTPLKPLLSNRYDLYISRFTYKYLNNFAPDVLFLKGDPTYLVSLWRHGYFYIIDFALIILGLSYLYTLCKPKFFFILALIALSPIPEAIRSDVIPAYAFHSVFQYPYLIILVGLGIASLRHRLPLAIFSLIYLVSFINFINIYFFQYPLYQPEGFVFSRQVLSQYLHRAAGDHDIYVITKDPDAAFRSYLFYTNSYTPARFNDIKSQYNFTDTVVFSIDRLHFASSFPKLDPASTLVSEKEITPSQFGPISRLSISRLSDKLELYSIYHDNICTPGSVNNLSIPPIIFTDLDLDHLSNSQFCYDYIAPAK